MKNTKSIIIGCIDAIILLISAAIAAISVPEWNAKTILGALFLFVPYTTLFLMLFMTTRQSAARIMQNQALVVIAAVYFIVELAVTFVFAILPLFLPLFLIVHLLILLVAAISLLIGYWAKAHIEE